MDWAKARKELTVQELAQAKKAHATMMANMPEAWANVQETLGRCGPLAKAVLGCGLAGKKNAFRASENGFVIGGVFEEQVSIETAYLMVTQGQEHWVIWAADVARKDVM